MVAKRVRLVLGVCVLAAGCGGLRPSVPPLNPRPTETREFGKFVWHDLVTNDAEAAKRFYGELFGWTFETVLGNEQYALASHGGRNVAGILPARESDGVNRSQWIGYVSVENVETTVAAVRAAGGSVYVEPREIPGRGRYAVVGDPRGAPLALLRSASGDPPDREPANGEWLWNELWTRDASASMAFYESLLGYRRTTVELPAGGDYLVLNNERGNARAGVLQHQLQQVPQNWLPYIRVADVAAIVARVPGLGGRVIYAPNQNTRNGTVAIIADPSGAAVTIQEWPPAGGTPGGGFGR